MNETITVTIEWPANKSISQEDLSHRANTLKKLIENDFAKANERLGVAGPSPQVTVSSSLVGEVTITGQFTPNAAATA